MSRKHLATSIFIFAAIHCMGQGAEVNVVFNNTADIKIFIDKLPKIKSAANPEGLLSLIRANPHIKSKNLSIRIAFFDRGFVGEMKLKQEHTLTSEGYIEQWKEINRQNNGILFLFVKPKDGVQYTFLSMEVSPKLEKEYLLPLIINFINERLSGDAETIVGDGVKYLAKLLVPVWNEQKIAEAEQLINNNPKYQPGRVNKFYGWFGFGFFNMRPATEKETENMKLVNSWSDPKMADKNWFFSNTYIFTDDNQLKGFSVDNIYDWEITFEKDNISGVYIFKDAFLYKILTYLEGTKKHHPQAMASTWNWSVEKNTGRRSISDFTGFADRKESDRLILFFDESYNEKEGEPLPKISGSATNTWCNIYACDLANQVLFGSIFGDIHNGPWGANQCANGLHYRISHDHANFKEVPLEEAWAYTMKGFVVYLTMFHNSMSADLLNSVQSEKQLCSRKSGHIATCFPEIENSVEDYPNNYVIQAGKTCGKDTYSTFLGDNSVKAHIYLGYAIK